MGRMPGYRQVTFYVKPGIYERARCAAYVLHEDIFEFVAEALGSAVERRITKAQRVAVDLMAEQNIKNGRGRVDAGARNGKRR